MKPTNPTPEFSRRSNIVLGSPYFTSKDDAEHTRLIHKRSELRDAIVKAGAYDKLPKDMKELFDKAEVVALKAIKEFEEFAAQDTGGYGRFHGTAI